MRFVPIRFLRILWQPAFSFSAFKYSSAFSVQSHYEILSFFEAFCSRKVFACSLIAGKENQPLIPLPPAKITLKPGLYRKAISILPSSFPTLIADGLWNFVFYVWIGHPRSYHRGTWTGACYYYSIFVELWGDCRPIWQFNYLHCSECVRASCYPWCVVCIPKSQRPSSAPWF